MSFGGILFEVVFGGCFAVFMGILFFTIGLREFQGNLKIREIGKSVFKKIF